MDMYINIQCLLYCALLSHESDYPRALCWEFLFVFFLIFIRDNIDTPIIEEPTLFLLFRHHHHLLSTVCDPVECIILLSPFSSPSLP